MVTQRPLLYVASPVGDVLVTVDRARLPGRFSCDLPPADSAQVCTDGQ